MTTQQERRGALRYTVRLSADISAGKLNFTTSTQDVSVTGTRIRSRHELEAGVPVQVQLFLVTDEVEDPTFPMLTMRGAVAWCAPQPEGDGYWVGIRFEGVTPQQVAWLTKYLKMLLQARSSDGE